MVSACLLLLLGVAALAVDLSAIRLDRAADQRVTDAAASAGALGSYNISAEQGCRDALAYVSINTEGIGTLDNTQCATVFSAPCTASTGARPLSLTAGRWDILVVHPVPDDHALMDPAQIGALPYSVSAEDGIQCQRFGVAMTATQTSTFSRVVGSTSNATWVHSVATVVLPNEEPPINLLVLDRFGCDAIHTRGQGGVIVDAVVDPDTGDEFAGLAAADSDASSGCSPSVIHAEGNALIRADGPRGCVGELTPGTGEGCGLIQTLAPGTPGCNPSACRIDGANAVIAPAPTALPERLTRKQIDHEYNCWVDYTWASSAPGGVSWATDPLTATNEQDIAGCTDGSPAHIYSLIGSVGANGRAGHVAWNADLSNPCNVVANNSVAETGNIWVDCDDFIVEGDVMINGNVIFQGNVHVKSDGSLSINNAPGWVVFRGQHSIAGTGLFKKDGQASLSIQESAVYLSKTSWVEIAGGANGSLDWVAPVEGVLDDLALWSDSPQIHYWSGQGILNMVGVFFTPLATADYSGTSGQNQTEAQWIADKLVAHGQGKLEIQPLFQFPLKRSDTVRTTLIR